MLDFLKEIVEPIPDPSAGGTIDLESKEAQANSENALKKKRNAKGKAAAKAAAEGEEPAPKKRRKKKMDVDPTGTQEFGEEVVHGVFAAGEPTGPGAKGWV